MHIRHRQWSLAFAIAILAHAGLAAAVLWEPDRSGAVATGVGGVEVSLGAAGGAPGSVASTARVPETADGADPDDARPADVRPVEAEPVEAESAPVEQVKPAEVEPETPREALETVPVESARPVEQVEAAKPPEVETAGLQPPTEVEARTIEPTPVSPPPPKPKPVSPKRTRKQVSPPPVPTPPALTPMDPPRPTPTDSPDLAGKPERQTASAAASMAGAGGKAGVQNGVDAGSGADRSGGGVPGSSVDYMARLQAWLERHKEYPRRARMRGQEGVALLYFAVDRDGRVLEHRIHRSSGHASLDREVIAMIERAKPLPKMPPGVRQNRLELLVPVQFFLR